MKGEILGLVKVSLLLERKKGRRQSSQMQPLYSNCSIRFSQLQQTISKAHLLHYSVPLPYYTWTLNIFLKSSLPSKPISGTDSISQPPVIAVHKTVTKLATYHTFQMLPRSDAACSCFFHPGSQGSKCPCLKYIPRVSAHRIGEICWNWGESKSPV